MVSAARTHVAVLGVAAALTASAVWGQISSAETTGGSHVNYKFGEKERKALMKQGAQQAFGGGSAASQAARMSEGGTAPPTPEAAQAEAASRAAQVKAMQPRPGVPPGAPPGAPPATAPNAGPPPPEPGTAGAKTPGPATAAPKPPPPAERPGPALTLDGFLEVNGVLFVPARAAVQALGGTVVWHDRGTRAVMLLRGTELVVWPRRATAQVDGRALPVSHPARMEQGVLLIPAGLFGTAWGIQPRAPGGGGPVTFVLSRRERWNPFGLRPAWPMAQAQWPPVAPAEKK